ncbi:252_t:CDS:2, partial [Paraglomus occultum]
MSNTRVAAGQEKDKKHPPAVVLTYASLERRLDTIVFRACLATSIWQARQMVLRGKVSVNGVKTPRPAHHASPGDIISVVPNAIPLLSEPATESGLTFKSTLIRAQLCTYGIQSRGQEKVKIPSPFPPDLHALAYE